MKKADRERAVIEVVSRVVEEVRRAAQNRGESVEDVVADTLFHERQRLEHAPRNRQSGEESRFYRDLGKRLLRASEHEQLELVRQIADRFAREVVGRFNPWVYQLATRALPVGAGVMVNAISPLSLLRRFPDLPRLDDQVVLRGATDALKAVAERGTVILAPTHQTHLDSVVLGYALFLMGLPPFIYGAGLNLFSNPLLGFFMHNLGAYKVDRRKQSSLYKQVLKEYATITMEYGYHNLFFPGGTRSRSGAVERHLKLGLLGCGLQAFVNNLRRGAPRPNVYLVPCTLSYGLVLEAATLIDDHLQEAGRSRYIIEDDEFSQPRQVFNFVKNLISLDAKTVMHVSEPLDVLGNRVLPDGTSVDDRGRPVDASRYVMVNDAPGNDPQRDQEYTREAGRAVTESFRRDATFLPTNLLAFVVFGLLRARALDRDLFRFLRTADELGGVPLEEVLPALARLHAGLVKLTEAGTLGRYPVPFGFDPEAVVADGLRYFATYHDHEVVFRRGDRLFPGDLKLLYFYRNRLDGYGLDAVINTRLEGRS